MTPDDVGKIVLRILGSWPVHAAKVDSHAMTIAYGEGLLDLEYKTTLSVVQELAKTEIHLPSIASIRERVVARRHGERRRGIEAWGDVTSEVRRVGRIGRPRFADPLVSAAVSTIGWSTICNSDETDPAVRSRFCERYDQIASLEYRNAKIAIGARSNTLPAREERGQLVGSLVRGLLENKTTEDDE